MSYSLKFEDLKKLYYQAVIENKIPVFEIEFPDMTFVVLDKNDFIANIDGFNP